jgi:hypothetical protein
VIEGQKSQLRNDARHYTQGIMLTSADVFRWLRQMHGQSAPVQGQAALS